MRFLKRTCFCIITVPICKQQTVRKTVGHSDAFTVKTTPCFRYEGETREERNLVIFKDTPMNNHIKGELSTRPFH